MAIAMVAMLAFGGTYAYFTASAKDVVATGAKTGAIQLSSQGVSFAADLTKIIPGDTILSAGSKVTVPSTSESSYVAIRITVSGVDNAGEYIKLTPDSANWTKVSGDLSTGEIYAYKSVVAAGGDAVINAEDIKFVATDVAVEGEGGTFTYTNNLMLQTLTIKIEARSIQSENLTTADQSNINNILAGLFTTNTLDGPTAA